MSCAGVMRLSLSIRPMSSIMRTSSRLFCVMPDDKYDVPRYNKVNAWDRDSMNLKTLGKILSSKRDRVRSDSVVLEGTRMIKDAISLGFSPSVVVFSREKLLWQLDLPKDTSSKLYHIPYNNIKMWTDLTTTPGIMAAFSKEELVGKVVAKSPLPITLVCDNIRQPDNLGAVLRVAAAAGAQQVVLTPGCVDAWAPKVLRAGAGAHFLVPVVEGVGWDTLAGRWPMVVLADLIHGEQEGVNQVVVDRMLEELDNVATEEGKDMAYQNQELCERYKELPVRTKNYSEFELDPGYDEVVVVVGGETEGVSSAAYMFCHQHSGVRLHVPLRNTVNSLNVISAASLVLFKVQEVLAKVEVARMEVARMEVDKLEVARVGTK
eukprot:TRINITY_DN7742_c0_g1_i3.p1 TRINITY_DN7742_c0_g1~~TRINITY_DN7742_c0_g1_i3.p1  ORF type:complete len:377 (-),score=162.96 TRINITY_DN7742_c0_g1_i3:106-1236(-)